MKAASPPAYASGATTNAVKNTTMGHAPVNRPPNTKPLPLFHGCVECGNLQRSVCDCLLWPSSSGNLHPLLDKRGVDLERPQGRVLQLKWQGCWFSGLKNGNTARFKKGTTRG